MNGQIGEELNISDWSHDNTLWASAQEKNRCSREHCRSSLRELANQRIQGAAPYRGPREQFSSWGQQPDGPGRKTPASAKWWAVRRSKFDNNTMRLNNVGRQEVQVTGFGGHTRNRRAEVRTQRAKDQGATGRRKGAIKTLPCNQERPIERRQDTRVKRKRVRKNLSRRRIKRRLKPERHEGNPAGRSRCKAPNPLAK